MTHGAGALPSTGPRRHRRRVALQRPCPAGLHPGGRRAVGAARV